MHTRNEVQRRIRARIDDALDGRSWRWLARRTGVPWSTLQWQATKPRFTATNLVRIAQALNLRPSDLLDGIAEEE